MEKNKKQYQLVIFDVDGTLMDTSEGLLQSTILMMEEMKYEIPCRDVLLSFVGPRIQDSLQRVYGLQGEELNQAATVFRNYYKKEQNLLRAKPYDGIFELLEYLKEKKMHMAVATNKRQDFVERLLEEYGFLPYVELICGTDLGGKLSKTDLIHKCTQEFSDCSLGETVLIGDSSYDAIAAHEAGIDFIGVTYGFDFHTKEDVIHWNNAGIADSPRKIKEIL